MSNLSELLPAGGSAKEFEAVASGTLPNGRAVVLKANGQVEVVAQISAAVPKNIPTGSETVFNAANTTFATVSFDPNTANKFVVAYRDNGNSGYGTAIVGTVSGSSISFGSEYVFRSGTTGYISVSFDPNTTGKFVVVYRMAEGNNYGRAVVGTLSGTSLSFSSEYTFNSNITSYVSSSFNPDTAGKFVVTYRDNGNNSRGTAIIGTVSGTSISFGSEYIFNTGDTIDTSVSFDPNNSSKFVVSYGDDGNSGHGTVSVGTVSGTSISFGSKVVFNAGDTNITSVSFDPNNSGKFVVAYQDNGNSGYGTAIIGTVSGTSTSYGSEYVFYSTGGGAALSVFFDPNITNTFLIAYRHSSDGNKGKAKVGTVSGTSISYGSEHVFDSSSAFTVSASVDPNTAGKFVVAYRDTGNSSYGTTRLGQIGVPAASSLTATNFVGTSTAAFTNGQTATIVPKGGVATSVSNVALSQTTGSKVVFDDAGPTTGIALVYDPDTAKVVNVFCTTTVQGIVGTVSGTSISYGSAASANGNSSSATQVAYDTVNNKIVAVYKKGFNDARVVIGTVSGTAISWGTPVVFASVNAATPNVAFDTNAGKVLIVYKDQANSNHGKAVVGTVSGTSISIGSPVTFLSANANKIQIAYDANAQKSVLVVEDYSNSIGVAYVATISGTSVSFGSQATFLSAAVLSNSLAITYNSTDNKVVIGYGKASDNKGYLITGTVSGTSISFAGETVFSSTTTTNDISLAYKASGNVLGMVYNIGGSTTVKVNAAVISGTSFSLGTEQELTAGATDTTAIVVDSASGNFVASYGDGSNNYDGTSNVVSVSTSLTIGTTYYVQADGTVSTVSTSPAIILGKAVSSTSLILKGNS